jgi:hypothetical protein
MLKNRVYFFVAIAALFAAPALFAAQGSNDVKLGETRYFKNWAAGCDNGLTCEAVSLLPPELPAGMLSLVLARGAGKDAALKINVFGFDSESDRYQLFVDGVIVDSGPITQDIAPISVTGKDALKLASALVKGSEASIVDGAGKTLGKISLTGSSAALRYLDVKQRRAGTLDALVARGKRKHRGAGSALPVIAVPRIAEANDIPDASALVALAESGSCAEQRVGVTQDSVYGLGTADGKPRVLALISCGNGAYNFSSAPFIGTKDAQGKWKFEAASFDHDSSYSSEKGDVKLIVNAGWDAAKQTLSTFNKGRGIGDCGSSADYVWDGNMFRLIHARSMEKCQGSLDWITVWRADVAYAVNTAGRPL